jgi:hypothetical protein
VHACATSARARRANLRRRYWMIRRAAVTVTSTAALANTAPCACPILPAAMIRTNKRIKLAKTTHDRRRRIRPSLWVSATDVGACGRATPETSRVRGGTPKHAANIAQPRQAMIMINGRASAGCPVLSPCETAAVARRER